MILMYYTRQPLDEAVYAPRLAYSLHMALCPAKPGDTNKV